MKNEYKQCKGCRKPVAPGDNLTAQAARELGYCRYCYRMNVSNAPDRRKQENLPDETIPESEELQGADVFDPAQPWDWYEYFFPKSRGR